MRFYTTLLFIFAMVLSLNAQVAIGEWKSYLPYKSGVHLTQSDEKIIYATDWSIMTIDKDDTSIKFLSKVEGLSDVGISAIKYDKFNDFLIIAYQNSNIDLVSNDNILNLPNIATNTDIIGDKQIYDLHVAQNDQSFLATGFGVVELRTDEKIFGFTTFMEMRVNAVSSSENNIYAATEDGLYYAPLNDGLNLGDFNNWTLMDNANNLPSVYEANSVEIHNGEVYLIIDNDIWKSANEDNFELIYTAPGANDVSFLSSQENYLLTGYGDDSGSSTLIGIDSDGEIIEDGNGCSNILEFAIEDEQGRIWLADQFIEFRFKESFTAPCSTINPNSPLSHFSSEMAIKGDKVYIASGGATEAYFYQFRRTGFYIFDDGEWRNFNENSFPFIKDNDLLDFFRIAPHPFNDKVYIGTYWGGIMELDLATDESVLFDKNNSSLQGTIGDEARTRISGLAFDDNANLWVSNFGAPDPLSVYTSEGVWHSYDVISDNRLAQLVIDQNGFKWSNVIGINGGVLVYDDKRTPENPTDDEQRFFNVGNSVLTTNLINCLEVDLDGNVWVGTAQGPIIFECGGSVFDNSCQGSRRKITQDSIVAFLLENENINTIAVDGANRKWLGSRNGVFVLDPNGEEEIQRFNVENSPLFDNNIVDMVFEPKNGEMFIATNKGIQSIRTETTSGTNVHTSDVYAFPNPVRPDYTGDIAIKGLARDANVKITDIEGRLIFETTALGGQAIWDGNDFDGNRAKSGVYLVFSTKESGFGNINSAVTKILMVN